MQKTTEELINELKEADDIQQFMKNNENELLSRKIAALLNELIEKRKLSKTEVVKKSDIQKTYAYEILNGRKENPSRDKLIRLALAMGLDLDETQTLLKHSEMTPLYARNSRDSIIIFAINNKKSPVDCNILLESLGKGALE